MNTNPYGIAILWAPGDAVIKIAEGMALLNAHGTANPLRHLVAEAQMAVDHHASNKEAA